jgi:hypothetical protein
VLSRYRNSPICCTSKLVNNGQISQNSGQAYLPGFVDGEFNYQVNREINDKIEFEQPFRQMSCRASAVTATASSTAILRMSQALS